jgi:hypothetical protein
MVTLIIASVGATLTLTQGFDLVSYNEKSSPQGALLTGNVKVTQFDKDGNIIAYRQSDNHIVETGMQTIMGQVFDFVNDTYTVPSSPVSHMAIGTDGEWRLLYNDTDLRAPVSITFPSCNRFPITTVNSTFPGSSWGPEASPGSCTAPNCSAQMNITASASFFGGAPDLCAIPSIDEAGIYSDSTLGSPTMFARNNFGSVTLQALDTLQLDWEFTFTDA